MVRAGTNHALDRGETGRFCERVPAYLANIEPLIHRQQVRLMKYDGVDEGQNS